MAITTSIPLTSTWTQIAASTDDFAAQSRSNDSIEVIYKASPVSGNKGHIIKYLEGVSSAVFGKGDVWARTNNNAVIVVTK